MQTCWAEETSFKNIHEVKTFWRHYKDMKIVQGHYCDRYVALECNMLFVVFNISLSLSFCLEWSFYTCPEFVSLFVIVQWICSGFILKQLIAQYEHIILTTWTEYYYIFSAVLKHLLYSLPLPLPLCFICSWSTLRLNMSLVFFTASSIPCCPSGLSDSRFLFFFCRC